MKVNASILVNLHKIKALFLCDFHGELKNTIDFLEKMDYIKFII